MHQIIGLRKYVDPKTQLTKQTMRFLNNKWRAFSLDDVLMYPDKYLEQIPEKERYNIFVTLAKCHEGPGRRLEQQNVIPFDIDKIDYQYMDRYLDIFCDVMKVPRYEIGVIATGNGLHIFIGIKLPILDEEFFVNNQIYYKELCYRLSKAFDAEKLPYKEVDPMIFNPGFMTRLPGTDNVKDMEGTTVTKPVKVINAILTYGDFDLREASGLVPPSPDEVLSKTYVKEYFKEVQQRYADDHAVLNDCAFMVYASTSKDLSERQWFNALNIASHLRNGFEVCHTISKHDPRYNYAETQQKAASAYEQSGPFKCSTIARTFEGCVNCPHYERNSSPITLRSEDYIATLDTDFRFLTDDGKPGRIDFEGLVKAYKKQHKVISLGRNMYYEYNGKYWVEVDSDDLCNWAFSKIKPIPKVSDCQEFVDLLRITSKVQENFFSKTTEGYMNFRNGILELASWTLVPHSESFGFTSIVDFDYDPEAKCPLWEKTMDKVLPDKPLDVAVLQEFFGYALSGTKITHAKALIMNGDGSNGKSTIIDVFKHIIKGNYSSLPWSSVMSPEKSYQMSYKLVNFSEEVGKKDFIDSTNTMKLIIAGGEYQTRKLYCNPITIRNRTKFILACNKLPATDDLSYGFIRRMILIDFKAEITPETDPDFDINIKEKLEQEASGILNWCIEGYKRLVEQGGFSSSDDVNRALSAYLEENNPIISFFEECIEVGDDYKESFQALYDAYVLHCKHSGVKSQKKVTFLKEFEKYCHKNKVIINRTRYRMYKLSYAVGCYEGLCVRANLDKQSDSF